jgi:hypothetical protein
MPHEIHVSERRSFRGCRRRWDWAYRVGYVPEISAKPLEFGIAYHLGMEAFYDPKTWSTTTPEEKAHKAVTVFTLECEKQRKRYLEITNQTELDEAQGDDYSARIELGTGMLAYHAQYVHAEYDGWFKPVATEISFAVPIIDPDDPEQVNPLKCTNSPACGQAHSNDTTNSDSDVVYAGRVDMVVEDLRYGGYFIWDHKTAGQLATDDGFLQLDDQVASYCWALSVVLGLDIRGFIYAESRKDYPRPPKLLKRKYNGCIYSTSRTQATNLDMFVPTVQKGDPIAYQDGLYDDYIEFLSSAEATVFHQRFTIVKSNRELAEVGRNISLEAADMVDSNLRIYPSVGRYTCSTCAYRQPCLSSFLGEDVLYQLETNYNKTTSRYYHTVPPTSEKNAK